MKTPPPPPPDALALIPKSTASDAVPVVGDVTAAQKAAAAELFANARAENTFKAFRSDWALFDRWCAAHGHSSLPAAPDVVALYVVAMHQKGLKLSTVQRRLSTIRRKHQLEGRDPPASESINLAVAGVARTRGRQKQKKDPLVDDYIRRILPHIPNTLLGIRDRAVLLVSYAGAFRSAEVAALTVADIEQEKNGDLVLNVRRSKTKQEWSNHEKPLALRKDDLCAVTALHAWLKAAAITDGPVFRPLNKHGQVLPRAFKPHLITHMVKTYALAAGLDPSKFASHSLRAGHVTQRFDDGEDPFTIRKMTGHTNMNTLAEYDRRHLKDRTFAAMRPKEKK